MQNESYLWKKRKLTLDNKYTVYFTPTCDTCHVTVTEMIIRHIRNYRCKFKVETKKKTSNYLFILKKKNNKLFYASSIRLLYLSIQWKLDFFSKYRFFVFFFMYLRKKNQNFIHDMFYIEKIGYLWLEHQKNIFTKNIQIFEEFWSWKLQYFATIIKKIH